MDGKPCSQQTCDGLVQPEHHLDSRREPERLQLQQGRTTEALDNRSKPTFPIDIILAIIEQADKSTLCKLARVSRDVSKHALHELYTHLDLLGWDWELYIGSGHTDSESIEISIVSGIGEGILAFVKGTNSGIAAKTLEIEVSSILRFLHLWAAEAIGEREPVLKHLASVKAITCLGNGAPNDLLHTLDAIPTQMIPEFTHLSISHFHLLSGLNFGGFPRGLTSLEITNLMVSPATAPLFESDPRLRIVYQLSVWASA